jgi:hypothetical protein
MKFETPLPMVRCRLDDSLDTSHLRYVPAAEFGLWRNLMLTQHHRPVVVDQVSVWVPDTPRVWGAEIDADRLEPVLRVRFERREPGNPSTFVPVIRFMPVETYPEARKALLAHFDDRCRETLTVTPGYFVAATAGDTGSRK